jgi:hypothetical protein
MDFIHATELMLRSMGFLRKNYRDLEILHVKFVEKRLLLKWIILMFVRSVDIIPRDYLREVLVVKSVVSGFKLEGHFV